MKPTIALQRGDAGVVLLSVFGLGRFLQKRKQKIIIEVSILHVFRDINRQWTIEIRAEGPRGSMDCLGCLGANKLHERHGTPASKAQQ